MACIEENIKALANKYSNELLARMNERELEMQKDDKSHYLIYEVLGISTKEGDLIDLYQNKGRFLYKYAGSFLEEAAIQCFQSKFCNCQPKVKVKNTITSKPQNVEIDCLVNDKNAYEIKWRDATTDGDHITKEHTRIKVIKSYGYNPIRIMFYYPNRDQAIRIQDTLKTVYAGVGGEYYFGDLAWDYIRKETDIDLKGILLNIAKDQGRF